MNATEPRRRWLWQALKLAIGLGLLWWAVRAVDLALLVDSLVGMQAGWLVVALGMVVAGQLLKVLRWWLMLRGPLPEIGPMAPFGALVTGQSLNMLTWARLGDVARIALLTGQTAGNPVAVTATVVAEKLLDLVFLVLLSLVLLGQTTLVTLDRSLSLGLIALLGLAIFFVGARYGGAMARWLRERLTAWRVPGHARLGNWLVTAAEALRPLTSWRLLLGVVAVSTLIWGTAWATNEVLFFAAGLPLPPQAALLALVLAFIGLAPGLTPTNIAPVYFTTIFSLGLYGVAETPALAYAAVLHLLITGVPVLSAAGFLVLFRGEWALLRKVVQRTPPVGDTRAAEPGADTGESA